MQLARTRQVPPHGRVDLWLHASGQHRVLVLRQGRHDAGDLLRALAGRPDHLRLPGALGACNVQLSKVRHLAGHRM